MRKDTALREALDVYRLKLCVLSDSQQRERLILDFDALKSLVDGLFEALEREEEDSSAFEDERDEIEQEKNDLEEELKDKKDANQKLTCVLAHLQETIGLAICLAEKPEHRLRFHTDYDLINDIGDDEMTAADAAKRIREIKEANHVA